MEYMINLWHGTGPADVGLAYRGTDKSVWKKRAKELAETYRVPPSSCVTSYRKGRTIFAMYVGKQQPEDFGKLFFQNPIKTVGGYIW